MCMTQYGSAVGTAAAGAIDVVTAVAAAAGDIIDADRGRPVCIISQRSYRIASIYTQQLTAVERQLLRPVYTVNYFQVSKNSEQCEHY